jgi:hypothetical protein
MGLVPILIEVHTSIELILKCRANGTTHVDPTSTEENCKSVASEKKNGPPSRSLTGHLLTSEFCPDYIFLFGKKDVNVKW